MQPKINTLVENGKAGLLVLLSSVLLRGSSLCQSLKRWNTVSDILQNLPSAELVRLRLNRKVLVGIEE